MSVKDKATILKDNTSWIYFSKIVNQLFVLVANIYVIRQLPVEVFGSFNFIISVFIVISIFALSPINSVINRYIPEYIEKKYFGHLKKVLFFGFLTSLLYLILFVYIIYIFQNPFGNFFNINDFSSYIYYFIIYAFLKYFKDLSICILNASLLHKKTSLLNIFDAFLRATLYIIFLKKLNVKYLLMIEASLAFIYVIPALFFLLKFIWSFPKLNDHEKFNKSEKKRIMKFWFFSSLSELGAGIVNKTSDFYIISAMSNQYYVGLYSFAYKLYNIIYQAIPLKEILSVLRPLFIQKFSGKEVNNKEFNTIYNLIIKIMLPICLLPSLYFISLGKPLINLVFDPKYLDAYWVTSIALMGFIIVALFYPLGLTIILKEKMDIALYSKIVVIFSIFGGIVAMKFWGIVGVALATLVGNILKNLLMLILFKKIMKIEHRISEMKSLIIASIIFVFIFHPIGNIIDNILVFILISLIFLVLFCLVFIFFHPFTDKDQAYLNRLIGSSKILTMLSKLVMKIYAFKSN